MKQHIRSVLTQRKWGRQRSASGIAPQSLALNTKIGYQIWYPNYWGDEIFIDLVKTAHPDWTGQYDSIAKIAGIDGVDSNSWITSLPPSTTWRNTINTQQNANYVRRPGVYVATWTGTALVVLQNGYLQTGLSGGHTVGSNRYEITLASGGPYTMEAHVTNPSSTSTVALNDLRVFHIDDEADLASGKLLTVNHRAKLQGIGTMRSIFAIGSNQKDGIGWDWRYPTIAGTVTEFSAWKTEAARTWCSPDMPPSVYGKICAELNCDMHLSLPAHSSDACILAWANALYPVVPAPLKIKIECSNEATWNYSGEYAPSVAQLVYQVGPTLTGIKDDNGNASTAFYPTASCAAMKVGANMWRIFETVFPRNRIVRVHPGAALVGQGNESYGGLHFIEPISGLQGKQLADEFSIAPYMRPTSGESIKSMKHLRKHLDEPPTFAYDCMRADLGSVAASVAYHSDKLSTVAPGMKLSTYEAGSETLFVLNTASWKSWEFLPNGTDNVMGSPQYGGQNVTINWALTDGGRVRPTGGDVTGSGLSLTTMYYFRVIGTDQLRLYSGLANYNANTPVTISTTANRITLQSEDYSDNYIGYFLTADNSLNSFTNEDWSVDFDDGEAIQLASVGGTALYTGTDYYIKKLSTTKMQLFASASAAAAGTPVLSLAGGNNAVIQFDNNTRTLAIAAKFNEMWASQLGADLWTEYFSKMDGKIDTYLQHVPFSNAYTDRMVGVLSNAAQPYTPLMTAMRALAVARKGGA
jgi:hypothetical protein